MTVLSAAHLFEQAERLITPPKAGPPRQVDIRRAISDAYYGVFHFTLTELADEFIGVTQRGTSRYAVIYRGLDHRTLREVCNEVERKTPSTKYAPYLPPNGFGSDMRLFANVAVDLQAKRHRADYNPEPRFKRVDAQLAIVSARIAVDHFTMASAERQKAFLTLLLSPPR